MQNLVTLQNIVFPEISICSEGDLYFHLNAQASYHAASPTVRLLPGGTVGTGTYFNAFGIGKWHKECTLDGLFLTLSGIGEFELKVWHAIPDKSWEVLAWEIITLSPDTDFLQDISHYKDTSKQGLIYFELKSLGDTILLGGSYQTRVAATQKWPRLAVSITTFRREVAVRATVARIQDFLNKVPFGQHVHTFVVDNGQSAEVPASSHVTPITNANLGGAGGFARGLLEATKGGFDYCLFMDDDASFLMENIYRTYMFLALSNDPKSAVAGAMINNNEKWRMWENGAVFDHRCLPQFSGLDLRDLWQVFDMELHSVGEKHPFFYGGWWYFAFPVNEVTYQPFPFFVRGDDVSFSIANDFHIHTLNGVVSFQDHFIDKESPLVWYLDLRSHMAHHLSVPGMESSGFHIAKIAWWFYLRNLVRFQYETLEAIVLAWQDVVRGPQFFAKNADMSERRQRIGALTKTEHWRPANVQALKETWHFHTHTERRRRFLKWSLNGHLLPFYNLWSNKVVIQSRDKGSYHNVWGSGQLTYVNNERDKTYTVRQSKLKFISLTTRAMITFVHFMLVFPRLQKAYQKAYPELTSAGFWQEQMMPPGPGPQEDKK